MTRYFVWTASLTLALGVGFSAAAADPRPQPLPFEPVYAADQTQVNFDAMNQEYIQFQELAKYRTFLEKLDEKIQDSETLKAAFERGKKIVDGYGISPMEFAKREHDYHLNLYQIAELKAQIEQSKYAAEVAREAVILYGSGAKFDLRKKIAGKMKRVLELQIQSLEHRLAGAQYSSKYHEVRVKMARQLVDGGNLALDIFEQVEDGLEEAEAESKSALQQMDVLKNSLAGVEKTLKRLSDEESQP